VSKLGDEHRLTSLNRIQFVLFGMQSMKFCPYLAAIHWTLISLEYSAMPPEMRLAAGFHGLTLCRTFRSLTSSSATGRLMGLVTDGNSGRSFNPSAGSGGNLHGEVHHEDESET
jgi:hypothetical protein